MGQNDHGLVVGDNHGDNVGDNVVYNVETQNFASLAIKHQSTHQ
jgi:hypothetical protein